MTTTTTPNTTKTARRQPQLVLVLDGATAPSHWHLDDKTREIGRQGLLKARAALHAARPAHLEIAA